MARYARPSNADYFAQISHAFSPRSGVRVDAGQASSLIVGYSEGVGYYDYVARTMPVGVGWNDPYLGPGVLLPGLIIGVPEVHALDIQLSYMNQGCDASFYTTELLAASTLAFPATQDRLRSSVFSGSVAISTGALQALSQTAKHQIGGLGVYNIGFNAAAADTGISVNALGAGANFLVLVSRNTGAGINTASALYMLNLPYDGGTAPVATLVAGTAMANFGVSGTQTITIAGFTANNHRAAFLGNKPFT
jgi:hypothetical protein